MELSQTSPRSGPLGASAEAGSQEQQKYRYLVIDSGPIIRMSNVSMLWKCAEEFYTVPAVLHEIRDARARQHLDSLPFELKTREASAEGIQAIVQFSKQTGDYQSLSSVDLHVLGLLYDLEREGCGGDLSHVRATPKRVVGIGKVELLDGKAAEIDGDEKEVDSDGDLSESSDEGEEEEDDERDQESTSGVFNDEKECISANPRPMSWAAAVAASAATSCSEHKGTPVMYKETSKVSKQVYVELPRETKNGKEDRSQFSNASDNHDPFSFIGTIGGLPQSDRVNDGDGFDSKLNGVLSSLSLEEELQQDFPSLAASLHAVQEDIEDHTKEDEEIRKKRSLEVVSKSGKTYNSFRNYSHLLQPKPTTKKTQATHRTDNLLSVLETNKNTYDTEPSPLQGGQQSRILGGQALASQDGDVEDDGEGWIVSSADISTLKAAGKLDPVRNPKNAIDDDAKSRMAGPPIGQRAACSTTDFAMQNVVLQMNLELLSVDGLKVKKLKSWVRRCGACYKIYTDSDNTGPIKGRRLFCERCGSDMIHRISCSVDAKTGRLRLHLSKKYKHNLRGTKYSLPKPGTGNRFQGDLLLREDQLMTGAWNQKVKMRSGGKARSSAESIFGKDIAPNVGCNTSLMSTDDIQVGFGRRNPNAARGRERRGKKKKSTDKACGLRRY